MKKFKVLATALVASMLAFAPVSAMAAEATDPDLSVQLNGNDMVFTDAKPIIIDSRVFVPFRAVFEGLNADIVYDDTAKTIKATKGTTVVEFVIGDKNMKVTTDGKAQTIETDAASLVQNNRTYVPVRFAAQALGCTVGWDADDKTAVIVEKDIFAPKEGTTYELMNKYLVYINEFSVKPYALTGKFNFDVTTFDGEKSEKLTGVCALNGITDATKLNMNMVMDLDLAKIEELFKKEGTLDDATKAMLETLKKTTFDFIANVDTGKFYIKSNIFSSLMGSAEGTWYLLDMNELMKTTGFSFEDTMELSKSDDFAKFMASTAPAAIPVDDKDLTAYAIEGYKMMETLYSDSSFKKTGNDYVSTYTINDSGIASSTTFTLTTNGDKVEGYKMAMSSSFNGKEIRTVNASQSGLKTTIDMKMAMEGMFNMNLSGDITYSATTNVPVGAPGSTDKVVNFMDSLNRLKPIPQAPKADSVTTTTK